MKKLSLKTETNFIVDIIMFIIMMAIAGLGLLMKYVLIPGKDRWVVYGRNVDLYFFGLDRHEWGNIHFILSCMLLAFLVLHIILHWKMILGIYRNLIGDYSARTLFAAVFIAISVILIAFPFVVTPEINAENNGRGLHGHYQKVTLPLSGKTNDKPKGKSTVEYSQKHGHNFGSTHRNMTLYEISKKYNIPVNNLKKQLNIPMQESKQTKLVWLKKKYNFRMRDVREILGKSYDEGDANRKP